MDWYKGGTYEERERHIKEAIAEAKSSGKTVSLISESAGGAIALNIFSEDSELYRLVTLCAVNNPKTPVSPKIYARSPSFKAAVEKLKGTLPTLNGERRRSITVLTSLIDGTVKPSDSMIDGVTSRKLFAVGHIVAIATTLIFYGYYMVRLIKRS